MLVRKAHSISSLLSNL